MPIKLQHPEPQAVDRLIIDRLAEHIRIHQARVDEAPLSAPVSPLEIRAHLETRYGFGMPPPEPRPPQNAVVSPPSARMAPSTRMDSVLAISKAPPPAPPPKFVLLPPPPDPPVSGMRKRLP